MGLRGVFGGTALMEKDTFTLFEAPKFASDPQ